MAGEKERILMLLFSKHITNRLLYVAGFIGKELFDEAIQVTDNAADFQQYKGAKINYSPSRMEGALNISPHGLLFEKDIRPQEIKCFELNKSKVFFRATNSDIGFDVFAAQLLRSEFTIHSFILRLPMFIHLRLSMPRFHSFQPIFSGRLVSPFSTDS